LSAALRNELNRPGDCKLIRNHATRFSWTETAESYLDVLNAAIEGAS